MAGGMMEDRVTEGRVIEGRVITGLRYKFKLVIIRHRKGRDREIKG